MFQPTIILASQSPRRKQLLEWAEIPFEVVVSNTDETYPAHLLPEQIAIHIAEAKAIAVQKLLNTDKTIVAADTIVVLNNEIIGKPANEEHATNTLLKLNGKVHKVITGVVIVNNEKKICFSDTTLVEFYNLTKQQIDFYVNNYKPFDKAGAYAIQEWIGVIGIKSIVGDFYNVMGLPVSKVVQQLELFKNTK